MLRADLNKVHTWIYLFIEKAEEISASESRVTGCLKAAEGSLPKVLAPDFTARSLFLLPHDLLKPPCRRLSAATRSHAEDLSPKAQS